METTEKERRRILSIAERYAAETGYFGDMIINPYPLNSNIQEKIDKWYGEQIRESELINKYKS